MALARRARGREGSALPGRLWVRIQMLLSGTAPPSAAAPATTLSPDTACLRAFSRPSSPPLSRVLWLLNANTAFSGVSRAVASCAFAQGGRGGGLDKGGLGGAVSLKVTSRLGPPTWCAEDEQEVIHEPNSSRTARSPIPLAAYALAARSLSTCASPTAPPQAKRRVMFSPSQL